MNLITVTLLTALTTLGSAPDGTNEDRNKVLVRCKSEALIRGADVLLSDVASIECSHAELCARIGNIRLAGRPALGFNRVFPRADILRRLVSEGLSPKQVQMTGAKEVVAQPLATALKQKDITAVTDAALRAVLEQQGGDIEFDLQSRVSTMRVPPGRYDLTLRARLRGGKLQPSSATIELEILVDEQVFKTVQINYRLRHFAETLTTTRIIKRDELLGDSNLVLERIEVSPGSNMQMTSFDLVRGMVAARDIANNQQLRSGDVAKPAVIRKGDLVTLIARRGRIQVSTKAIALTDAPLGGHLQVRNISNKKVSSGVVYSSGIVTIPN